MPDLMARWFGASEAVQGCFAAMPGAPTASVSSWWSPLVERFPPGRQQQECSTPHGMGQTSNFSAWKQSHRPTVTASGVGEASSGCVRHTDCLASSGCWTHCCSFDARVVSSSHANSPRMVAVRAPKAPSSRADHERRDRHRARTPPATLAAGLRALARQTRDVAPKSGRIGRRNRES